MSYESLISATAEVHAHTQTGAAGAVNRYLTLRNWFIGAYVVQFEQNGADRASYGQQLLVHLARDLGRRRIPGCSPEMLGRMRVFYRTYPQLGENSSSAFATESGTSLAPTQIEISSPAVTKSDTALPTPLGGQTLLRLSWSHLIELIRLERDLILPSVKGNQSNFQCVDDMPPPADRSVPRARCARPTSIDLP
jgi:hypothetical protein